MAERAALDAASLPALTRTCSVVFTDTADFTVRTKRFGILHFLMAFDRAVAALGPAVRAAGGTMVKVEGDSMLLSFADARAACAGVRAFDSALRRFNRAQPEDERFRFSYGIGYGALVEVEGDLFGLELNLASKLGEDLARPGEALLTPSAALALGPADRRRLAPYRSISFKGITVPVRRLRLRRR